MRETEAVPALRSIVEDKKMWKYSQHRELRIAAAQALAKIDPRFGSQVLADTSLDAAELAVAPLDPAPPAPGYGSAATTHYPAAALSAPP